MGRHKKYKICILVEKISTATYGKYDCCQTEENHGYEAHPLGIERGGPLEDGDDEEDEGGGDADAAEEDTE